MDKNKGLKVPVQIRVNMWLGLSAHEKKFNSFSEGTFSVFAEMVYHSKIKNAKMCTFYIFTKSENFLLNVIQSQRTSQRIKLNMSSFSFQYENQAVVFGKWGTTGLVGRHKYSDVTGKLKLKQEYFLPPRGWEWEGEWFIDPEKA